MPEGIGAAVIGASFAVVTFVSGGHCKIWTLAAPSKHFAEHVKFPTFCCTIGADYEVYQYILWPMYRWRKSERTHGRYRNMLVGREIGGKGPIQALQEEGPLSTLQ